MLSTTSPTFSPTRVVIDTNVVIDLLHFADAAALPLLAALETKQIACFGDDDCLDELRRVLAYPEFALDDGNQKALFAAYGRFVLPCPRQDGEVYALPRCRDKDDQKFLTLAGRARADLLITRDKALLRLKGFFLDGRRCRIVDAATALELIEFAAKNPA